MCGKTSGSKLGHKYTNACDTSCNRCEATRTIKHDYKAATCTKAKTCKVCGKTSGSKLGHTYTNACDTSCNRCKATRTVKHSYSTATCTKAKTCKVCGKTSGSKLGHTYTNACDTSCNRCKATRTVKHSYSTATCTKAKTCKVCGKTSGKAGHTYTNSCDTSCNKCSAKRSITHKYTTVTQKATASANGYTVKRCSVCKKETGKTTVYKASSVKLSKTTYTYNGKAQKPTVTVKDSKGNKIASSNYTVKYATGGKNVGVHKVTVTFKGKYSGTKTLTYTINPAKTSVIRIASYKSMLAVYITKKTAQVSGYEVQYSTNRSFSGAKTVALSGATKTTATINCSAGKNAYFVRVRTYKTVNGKKYYSGWSSVVQSSVIQ